MNIIYLVVSLVGMAASVAQLMGHDVHYLEAYIAMFVLKLGIRLYDIEGSLKNGADRQLYSMRILGIAFISKLMINIMLVDFKTTRIKFLSIFVLYMFMCISVLYGMFDLIGETKDISVEAVAAFLTFPMLIFSSVTMQLQVEHSRKSFVGRVEAEYQFSYVLDLLQESIAIIDTSKLNKGNALEYVNDCFLASF